MNEGESTEVYAIFLMMTPRVMADGLGIPVRRLDGFDSNPFRIDFLEQRSGVWRRF